MKNPRSTGPPQLEANPLERLLSDANSLQLDSGNSSPDQTAELRAEEANSAELSPRTPSSEAPEEGAASSLQLDSGNSSPDQAPELSAEELSAEELSSAGLNPRAPDSNPPARDPKSPELTSALLSPPAISSELNPTPRSRVSLPAALCQLASDSLLAAKDSEDSTAEGTPRLLGPTLESPAPRISLNALNILEASGASS